MGWKLRVDENVEFALGANPCRGSHPGEPCRPDHLGLGGLLQGSRGLRTPADESMCLFPVALDDILYVFGLARACDLHLIPPHSSLDPTTNLLNPKMPLR